MLDYIILGLPRIESVQLSISNNCNYNCDICFDRDFHSKDENIKNKFAKKFFITLPGKENKCRNLALNDFYVIMKNLEKSGVKKINLIGHGEPFLNPDIFEMLKFLKKKNYFVRIASNFSKVTDIELKVLTEIYPDELQISINHFTNAGYKDITGTNVELQEIIDKILELSRCIKLQKIQCRLIISSVITKQNIGYYKKFIRQFEKYYDTIFFELNALAESEGSRYTGILKDDNLILKDIIQYLNDSKINYSISKWLLHFESNRNQIFIEYNFPCFASYNFAVILPDGSLLQCCESYYIFGNLINQDFKEIWYSPAYIEIQVLCIKLRMGKNN